MHVRYNFKSLQLGKAYLHRALTAAFKFQPVLSSQISSSAQFGAVSTTTRDSQSENKRGERKKTTKTVTNQINCVQGVARDTNGLFLTLSKHCICIHRAKEHLFWRFQIGQQMTYQS